MNVNARPRLGRLLVEKGLLTEAELAEALRIHEETGRRLGAIIIEDLRLVSVPMLADTLLLQQRWRPLGEMFVEGGILTEEQLVEALAEQERTGKPLGEVARNLFYVSRAAVDRLVEQQRQAELELERGYCSGLRSALLKRKEGTEDPSDESEAEKPRDVGLNERVELARAGTKDPHLFLAVKALERGDRKVTSLNGLVEEQRAEIDRLRESLQDSRLTIFELEQRVAELQSLVAAGAHDGPVRNGH